MSSFSKIIFFCFLTSCSFFKKEAPEYTVIKINKAPEDFKIPKYILDNVEQKLQDEGVKSAPVYISIPLTVRLMATSDQVLTHQYLEINLDNGGGQIDLKDIITGQGTFALSFPLDQFKEQYQIQNLYYISDVPQKNIDSEKFGIGCDSMIDLSTKIKKLEKNDFLKLNTTDLRYFYVVSGYYVFILKNKNQIYLTHVHITDSRYTDLTCTKSQ